jgi:hypothetical protein
LFGYFTLIKDNLSMTARKPKNQSGTPLFKKRIKAKNLIWLQKIPELGQLKLDDRLRRLTRDIGAQSRKNQTSENSLKTIPRLGRSIFGLPQKAPWKLLPLLPVTWAASSLR